MTDPIYGHPEDEGLAAERTELAWSRSGLALMACGVVVAKGLPQLADVPRRPFIGLMILVLGALTWAFGTVFEHQRRGRDGERRRPATWRDLAPVALGTAGVGVAGLLLAILE